jgi:hypothetical protein
MPARWGLRAPHAGGPAIDHRDELKRVSRLKTALEAIAGLENRHNMQGGMSDRYRLVALGNEQLVAALAGLVRRGNDALSDFCRLDPKDARLALPTALPTSGAERAPHDWQISRVRRAAVNRGITQKKP